MNSIDLPYQKKLISSIKAGEQFYVNLLIGILLVILHVRLHQFAFDDAYIHFRIAQNFFDSGYPYFNIQEAVKVSTSSGWTIYLTMLLFVLHALHLESNFILIVSVLNGLITLSGAIVFSNNLKKLSNNLSALTIFLFKISFIAILFQSSVGLMETPLAILLAGIGLLRLIQMKKDGFIILGAAAYFRPELIILLGLAALTTIWFKGFRIVDVLIYALIGLTPFIVFDLYYYQTIIPHSVIAKSIVYLNTRVFTLGFIFLYSLPEIQFDGTFYKLLSSILLICLFFFTGFSAFKAWRSNKKSWLPLIWLWGVFTIAAYVLEKSEIFPWYIPIYIIPILVASTLALDEANKLQSNILLFMLFVISVLSFSREIYSGFFDLGYSSLFKHGARVKVYLKVGEVLHQDYPYASLLIPEIGGLGYSFRGQVYDAVGLASPGALKFQPLKIPEERDDGFIGGIPPKYVELKAPDLIVSYDIFSKALLKDKIIDQYNIIFIPAYLPEDVNSSPNGTIWGSKYLRIFIRKGLPISESLLRLEK